MDGRGGLVLFVLITIIIAVILIIVLIILIVVVIFDNLCRCSPLNTLLIIVLILRVFCPVFFYSYNNSVIIMFIIFYITIVIVAIIGNWSGFCLWLRIALAWFGLVWFGFLVKLWFWRMVEVISLLLLLIFCYILLWTDGQISISFKSLRCLNFFIHPSFIPSSLLHCLPSSTSSSFFCLLV